MNTAELALSQQSSPLRPSLACRGTHTDDDDVLPLDPEQPPTAVKAEVRTERPEALPPIAPSPGFRVIWRPEGYPKSTSNPAYGAASVASNSVVQLPRMP